MPAVRTETGLRLILVALGAATLMAILPHFFTVAIATDAADPVRAVWLHTIIFPGIVWALSGSVGVSGLAGFLIVERSRRFDPGIPLRTWDVPRVSAVVSILAVSFNFLSGVVLGLVYVAHSPLLLRAIQIAMGAVFATAIGLYLYGTAGRMDVGSKSLRRIALALGVASVAFATAAAVALLVVPTTFDPVTYLTVALFIPASGTLSLIAWLVVYAGILGRLRSLGVPMAPEAQA